MPTFARALRIRNGMGCAYSIYWDKTHECYRVMNLWSQSLIRWPESYILLERQ